MDVDLDGLDSEKKLQHQLIDAGVKLLTPPSSIDELLAALDKVESLLSIVGQDPSSLIQDGLLPSMKALISDGLFRHPNSGVKISVMSCICEVLRITAPNQPYEDEKMKEIFQLTLAAFEKLSLFSGRCYFKALHILETVAKVRCCMILLDLGCDALVTETFELFLSTIRFNHPYAVFSNMEEIMTWLIDESDEISLDLLKPLLASVKKENQNTSPVSSWLGEKVLKNCSATIKPYLMKAVKSMRLNINDFADIVASLCRDMPAGGNVVMMKVETNVSHLVEAEAQLRKSLLADGKVQEKDYDDNRSVDRNSSKTSKCHEQIEQLKSMANKSVAPEPLESAGELQGRAGVGVVPSRRGRKPNSLIKPEEGYEYSGITGDGKSHEIHRKRKIHVKVSSLPNNSYPEKSPLQPEPEKENKSSSFLPRTSDYDSTHPCISLDQSDGGKSLPRKGRPKKKESMVSHDINLYKLGAKGVLLQDQLKKKSLQGSDGCLRIGSYKTEDAEEKSGRYSRRNKYAVKNNTETTSSVKNVVKKKEKDIQSDSEGKPLFLLKMQDVKKGMDDRENEESEGSKKPRVAKEYGEEFVGLRIKVWWPMDSEFYEGVIDSFDPSKKKHKVFYVDGDQEILNLKKERWFLLDRTTSDQDQKHSLPSSAVAPVKRQKKKSNMKNKIEQDESVSSERRSQTKGRKSGSKSAERSAVDILRIKTEIHALAMDDKETKDEEEALRSDICKHASESTM